MSKAESGVSFGEELDKPREHCALVGFVNFSGEDVVPDVIASLHDQQNRGEDGCGVAVLEPYGGQFMVHKAPGLVAQVFSNGRLLESGLSGSVAIGHNRYATSGSEDLSEKDKANHLQPYVVSKDRRTIALAHNGNIPERYLEKLRQELPEGIPLQSDTDSEIIAWRIMSAQGDSWRDKIANGLSEVVGAYSLVIATDEGDLFGIKDPLSIRPLVVARTENGIALVSESRGLEHVRAEDKKEVGPGKMVHIDKNGNFSITQLFPRQEATQKCVVEDIYFKHPYSKEGDLEVREIRQRMGEGLAKEFPFTTDYTIVGIPDSGIEIAEGYARYLGGNEKGLIKKDRYRPGRTFISESSQKRKEMLDLKFTISDSVEGKKIVIIDDSVIRGNTTRRLISSLRERGAAQVHVLSGSPRFINICDMGVDIAALEELIALKKNGSPNFEEKSDIQISQEIGADSVGFLSLDGLINAIGGKSEDFCTNCMTSQHPIHSMSDEQREIVYSSILPVITK